MCLWFSCVSFRLHIIIADLGHVFTARSSGLSITLDDHTLADIGFTRQQVLNGDFFNATDVVDFPAGSLGLTKTSKQDNKVADKKAA